MQDVDGLQTDQIQASKKREALHDLSLEMNQMNQLDPLGGNPARSPKAPHNVKKPKMTSLQAPKFSLEKLRSSHVGPTAQRQVSNEAIFKQARQAAELDSIASQKSDDGTGEKTIETYMEENEERFKKQLLDLQIQNDNYAHDSVTLRQSINELEYTNRRVKSNTQKLKEELYELDSKIDEIQVIIMNMKSQNLKTFKLKEKESTLECQSLANKLESELHELERELKREYEDVVVNFNDDTARKEIEDLNASLKVQQSKYESLSHETTAKLNAYEATLSAEFESKLKAIEAPLDDLNATVEAKKTRLDELRAQIEDVEKAIETQRTENTTLKQALSQKHAALNIKEDEIMELSSKAQLAEKSAKRKRDSLLESLTRCNDAKCIYEAKYTTLQIESAKKRRILHEINELRKKLYISSIVPTDLKVARGIPELDKETVEFESQKFTLNRFLNDKGEIIDECRCLLDDSLHGISVSVVIVGLTEAELSKVIEPLVARYRESITSMQHIDLDSKTDLIGGPSDKGELNAETGDISSQHAPFSTDIKWSQTQNDTLIRLNMSKMSSSITLAFLETEKSIPRFKGLLKTGISQSQDPILGPIYGLTRTHTVFRADQPSTMVELLQLADKLATVDSPNNKKCLR